MSAQIIQFKRPEIKRPENTVATAIELKRRIVGALSHDRFDRITRYLIDPGVSHEDRMQFINGWRKEWKMEPMDVRREN